MKYDKNLSMQVEQIHRDFDTFGSRNPAIFRQGQVTFRILYDAKSKCIARRATFHRPDGYNINCTGPACPLCAVAARADANLERESSFKLHFKARRLYLFAVHVIDSWPMWEFMAPGLPVVLALPERAAVELIRFLKNMDKINLTRAFKPDETFPPFCLTYESGLQGSAVVNLGETGLTIPQLPRNFPSLDEALMSAYPSPSERLLKETIAFMNEKLAATLARNSQ